MRGAEIRKLIHRVAFHSDQQAFKQLFFHYYDYLFHFSLSFVKSREVAEEIVEDAFVAIWKKRSQLPDVTNLKVYLYVTVRNLSVNYIKRCKPTYSLDVERLDVYYSCSTPTPEQMAIASEMRKAIDKAILDLPPKCRMVYKLVKEDGLRHKEVAEILQISHRTVEHHIASALRNIAKYMNISLKVENSASVHLRQWKKR